MPNDIIDGRMESVVVVDFQHPPVGNCPWQYDEELRQRISRKPVVKKDGRLDLKDLEEKAPRCSCGAVYVPVAR